MIASLRCAARGPGAFSVEARDVIHASGRRGPRGPCGSEGRQGYPRPLARSGGTCAVRHNLNALRHTCGPHRLRAQGRNTEGKLQKEADNIDG